MLITKIIIVLLIIVLLYSYVCLTVGARSQLTLCGKSKPLSDPHWFPMTDQLYPYTLLLITLIFSLYSYLDRSDGMNKSVGSLPWRNLSEMEVVKKFNSDALPNRTDTRTADEMCSNYSDYQCVPPLRIFEAKFRVGTEIYYSLQVRIAPKYKISTCLVQKCMSTVMQAIFCFLSDEDGFRQSGRKFFSETQHMRSCTNHFKAPSMQNLLWRIYEHNEDGWMHTMVIRDPVDRFLSGFIDKCIRDHLPGAYCNGCEANMTCFIIKEYERMVIEVKKDQFSKTLEDQHFFPQNWHCQLYYYPHRVFIRYSSNATDTMIDDLFNAFRLQKVKNTTLDFLRRELTSSRTSHSTIQSDARKFLEERYPLCTEYNRKCGEFYFRLRSSDFLMEYIVRMFYHDFRIFRFKLPDGFV